MLNEGNFNSLNVKESDKLMWFYTNKHKILWLHVNMLQKKYFYWHSVFKMKEIKCLMCKYVTVIV